MGWLFGKTSPELYLCQHPLGVGLVKADQVQAVSLLAYHLSSHPFKGRHARASGSECLSDPSLAGQGVWWEVISVLTWGFVL